MNPEAVNPAEMKPAESSGWLGSSLALVTALTGRADGLELRGVDVRAPWELPEGA
jgi:hypothetical protein